MPYGSIQTQPGYTRAPSGWAPKKNYNNMGGGYSPPGTSRPTNSPMSGSYGGKKPGFPKFGAAVTPQGGGASANISYPPAQQYNPATYNAQQSGDPNLDYMAQHGKGLMDPNSDYYKRLSSGMQQQIGQQSAAQQRAAALRGAWSGFGAGASPEAMATTADISQSGLEAQGQSEANLRLAAPQIGAGMLQSTFNPQLGYNQLNQQDRQYGAGFGEQSRQFGAGFNEQSRQFGAGMGLEQQRMAQQAAQFNAQAQMQQQQMQYQAMMDQMAMAYA